jgi:hypothetical protein
MRTVRRSVETTEGESVSQRPRWKRGGKEEVLDTYIRLHANKIIGEHWLWAAITRISQGEPEIEVMADYGYRREKALSGKAKIARYRYGTA